MNDLISLRVHEKGRKRKSFANFLPLGILLKIEFVFPIVLVPSKIVAFTKNGGKSHIDHKLIFQSYVWRMCGSPPTLGYLGKSENYPRLMELTLMKYLALHISVSPLFLIWVKNKYLTITDLQRNFWRNSGFQPVSAETEIKERNLCSEKSHLQMSEFIKTRKNSNIFGRKKFLCVKSVTRHLLLATIIFQFWHSHI